jgi:hypothetical protein
VPPNLLLTVRNYHFRSNATAVLLIEEFVDLFNHQTGTLPTTLMPPILPLNLHFILRLSALSQAIPTHRSWSQCFEDFPTFFHIVSATQLATKLVPPLLLIRQDLFFCITLP